MARTNLQVAAVLCYSDHMGGTSTDGSRSRVLLLSDASVLDLAVEAALRQDTELEIVDPELDLESILERVRTFAPDVIVVNEARQRCDSASLWQRLLQDVPGIRLIALSAHEASLSIYDGGTHAVKTKTGLLEAVRMVGLTPLGAR